jgi:GH24 family phage-related lysozyme (muramidase)
LFDWQIQNEFLSALKQIPYWSEMIDYQRGALLSFAYNLGANFYGSRRYVTITRVLKNKEWGRVPAALELYRNPGSDVEAGLLRRRIAEGKLWRKL